MNEPTDMKRRPQKDCFYIFIIAFFVRTITLFAFLNEPPATDTIFVYQPIAQSIINGDGYSLKNGFPTAIKMPLFPLFLALTQKIFGIGFLFPRAISVVIDSLMCLLLYKLAALLGDEKRAFLTGMLAALYPPFIWFASVKIGSETIFTFFLVLGCLFLIYAKMHNKSNLYIFSGCALGFATLTRSTTLFLPFFISGYLFLKSGIKRRDLLNIFFFLIFFIVTISPWPIRNYIVFNKIFPGETLDTNSFYQGSYPAFLTNYHKKAILAGQRFKELGLDKGGIKDEFTLRDLYLKAAILNYKELWAKNPFYISGLFFKKFIMIWYHTDSERWNIPMALLNLLILPLSLCGFYNLRYKFKYQDAALISLFIIYFVAACTIVFPLVRYMVPIAPFLLLFVPYCLKRE